MANGYGYGYGISGGLAPSKLCGDCNCCGAVPGTNSVIAAADTGSSTLIASGQFTFGLPLLAVDALGVAGWSFELRFLHASETNGLLGQGFNFTQNRYLKELDGGDVVLMTEQNTAERFELVGGQYSSSGNNTATVLTRSSEGGDHFKMLAADGTVTIFNGFDDLPLGTSPGRMVSITDRFGNTQGFNWLRTGSVDQLLEVTDGYGRTIAYTYFGSQQGYRLKEIEDFLGRKLTFQYDEDDRLVAVVTPAITKGAEGNTFPGGTAYVFQYDKDNPRPERRGDLIRIWYPNQTLAFLDAATRTVDVAGVYAGAQPRYFVEYGQDPTDEDQYGRVLRETVGNPNQGPGGTVWFLYTTDIFQLPANLIDPGDPIVSRTVVTDPVGNQTIWDFNNNAMPVRVERLANRAKLNVPSLGLSTTYVTWTQYNSHNQEMQVVGPEGGSVETKYDDGTVSGWSGPYARRIGLRLRQTRRPGNPIGVASRGGSGGQTELTTRYFHDPIFNQPCAVIEPRGNPIGHYAVTGSASPSPNGDYSENGTYGDQTAYENSAAGYWLWWNGSYWVISTAKGTYGSGYWHSPSIEGDFAAQGSAGGTAMVYSTASTYYTPDNGGTAPTDSDRSRYATITYFDYQKNALATITGDEDLQALLGLNSTQIGQLISHVDAQMKATDGTGGIPEGFPVNLGDVNGDGTGNGTADGSGGILPAARMSGNAVRIKYPSVRQLVPSEIGDPWQWVQQNRLVLMTSNAMGQGVTQMDPEGSLGVSVRYPYNDPEGDGQFVDDLLTSHQYGRLRESHVDADPCLVMDLAGQEADLTDFRLGKYVFGVWADNPTVYWRLDDSSGTAAADRSGAGLGGTYAGGCTLNQVGPLHDPGACVLLNGSSGYVDGGDAAALRLTGNLTMEAWVKVTAFPTTGNYATILSKGYDGTNTGYWLAIHNDTGTLKLIAGSGSGSAPAIVSWTIASWSAGQWVQVATRRDGTYWRLYFNGQQVAQASSAAAPVDTTPRKLYVGAFDNSGTADRFLNGSICEAAVYDHALTAARIQAHYEVGVAPSYLDLTTRFQGVPGGVGCSSCGYDALGNVIARTDPRGFTTTYDRNELGEAYRTTSPAPYNYRTEIYFDANRNVTRVDTEDKVVQYVSDDPTDEGYAKFTPTGSGSTAHVPTQAGPGGADRPGWFSNYYTYDLLDNKTQDDVDATGSTPTRLVTTYEYDPNQNLVKTTRPMGNIVEYDYDERNLPIATRVGYDASLGQDGSVSFTVYDSAGNVVAAIGPVDRLGGAGPTTLTAILADAFQSGSYMTHTGTWEVQNFLDGFGRVTHALDAVGNVGRITIAPDGRAVNSVREGTPGGASPTDRTGANNVELARSSSRFDEAGRAYESRQDVFLNTGGTLASPTHSLPSGRSVTHTGGGLEANATTNGHTATATLTAGDSSYVLARSVFDRSGQTILTASDNTAQTAYEYDGAGRQIKTTDALGNTVEAEYDPAGNAIRTTRTELAIIADPPEDPRAEVFRTYARYDSLERLVLSASQGADGSLSELGPDSCTWPVLSQTLVSRFGYDSRSNRTVVIDPKGNTAITVYDAAGRAVEAAQHLRADGDGQESFLPGGGASIRTTSIYDANGRTIELIDDRGGTTLYTYDTLDRQIRLTFHDGSMRDTVYNAASDVTAYIDENRSAFAFTLDAIGRQASAAITQAAGVVGTTAQSSQYDGLSRETFARDTADSADADASFVFDSLGRVAEEAQAFGGNIRHLTHTAFSSAPPSRFAYANGRVVGYNYDSLYRRTQVQNDPDGTPATIAQWWFFGPSRLAEVKLGNGLYQTHMNNARTKSAIQEGDLAIAWGDQSSDRLGYDGAGRMVCKRFLNATASSSGYSSTTSLVGFTTQFDMGSNKVYERALHAESRSHLYPGQDSLGRLLEYQRGTLAQAEDGSVSVESPITLPGTDSDRSYDLDHLGNWKKTVYTPASGSQTIENRRHNLLNQLTRFGTTTVLYDHGDNAGEADPAVAARGNGNVANDGTRRYVYDPLNRLKEVYKAGGGVFNVQIAAYAYDAFGRRIRKAVSNGGLSGDIPNGTTDYLYSGIRCVEDRNPFGGGGSSDTALRQYVWGIYVDELVQQRDIGSPNVDYYPLSDLLYRTTALTDASKAIAEAYDYDAYGNTLIFSAAGTGGNWFADDAATTRSPKCRYLFTGREYDDETAIYWYRARYYSVSMAAFLSRDSLGRSDEFALYEYVRGQPLVKLDYMGLQPRREPPPLPTNWTVTTDTGYYQVRLPGTARGQVRWCVRVQFTCVAVPLPCSEPAKQSTSQPTTRPCTQPTEVWILMKNISVEIHLFMTLDDAANKASENTPINRVFGHEQKHLRVMETYIKYLGPNWADSVSERYKKVFDTIQKCNKDGEDMRKTVQDNLIRAMDDAERHANEPAKYRDIPAPEIPRKGIPYDPDPHSDQSPHGNVPYKSQDGWYCSPKAVE